MSWFLAFMTILSGTGSWACLHYQNSHQFELKEALQEVFLSHDGAEAHMVLRTRLNAQKFPKELAWVIPFPSMPTKYEELDGPFFEELQRNSPEGELSGYGSAGLRKGVEKELGAGFKVHQTKSVGGFKIQPIEILNESAGNEFNIWLKKNKFNSMPMALQKIYLKKGAVFLALRMDLSHPRGQELVSRPLHISYKSNELTMPIKFTHDQRAFDLKMYVFSSKNLEGKLDKQYFTSSEAAPYKNEGMLPFVDAIIGKKQGFITLFIAKDLNGSGRKLRDLKQDPKFGVEEL